VTPGIARSTDDGRRHSWKPCHGGASADSVECDGRRKELRMNILHTLTLTAVAAAAAVPIAAAPADRHDIVAPAVLAPQTAPAGPYCAQRAPVLGSYWFSFVGDNGHHYDVYHGLPTSPFGNTTVDCDS
jgi:hypothetical protein